jgi:hypothetical protein
MKYRDIEYTLVQGLGLHIWKWTASVADVVIKGQGATKSEAVAEAEKAQKRCALLRPRAERILVSTSNVGTGDLGLWCMAAPSIKRMSWPQRMKLG